MRVLRAIENSTINMTKLQSSPIPSEPWHYMFHIDMEFDSMEEYDRVLADMERNSQQLHVYGVYNKGNFDTLLIPGRALPGRCMDTHAVPE